jgi:adenosylcobinamide-GDP ribazoletransferase
MTAIPLAFGSALALALLSGRQIGGYTGDVLGAAAVITECVALSVATGFGA